MARVETEHWWYQGLRDVIARTLAHPELGLPPAPAILDAGCGTGATLQLLGKRLSPSHLGGFDVSEEAVALARQKLPIADLYVGDLLDPELPPRELDLVLCLDVLSATGLDPARAGLARLVGGLRSRGLLLLHLPAYAWLRSEHDIAVHNRERFRLDRVVSLLTDLGLETLRASYRMTLLFPAVVASRLGSLLRKPDPLSARSQLHDVPSASTQWLLRSLVLAENRWVARGGRLPFGSSILVVGRKP